VGFAAAREHNEPALSGTAIGLVNGVVTGAGALFQPLLGWLLDLNWKGQIEAGARIYDPGAYQIAFSALVAMAVLGLACVLAMKETNCRPQR
jgi:MFS family permease